MDPETPPDADSASQGHPWATVGTGRGGTYSWFDPALGVGCDWGRHLPHWRQHGALYFVTFRTNDSIPAEVLAAWQAERVDWLAEHPEPHDEATSRDYHRRFTERMHRFLDEGTGGCPFREPAARQVVADVLLTLDGEAKGYALDAFVVMPNHAHVLVAPAADSSLAQISRTWKSVSAHRVNKLLGRNGVLWQHESWDHIVRRPQHLEKYRRYIRENPLRLPRV